MSIRIEEYDLTGEHGGERERSRKPYQQKETVAFKIIDTEGGLDPDTTAFGAMLNYALSHPIRHGMWWESVNVKPVAGSAGTLVLGEVIYSGKGNEREDKRKFPRYRFSTKGGTSHITHSMETKGEMHLKERKPADFHRAINVDKNGPQGVDIVTPAWQHSFELDFNQSAVTWNFLSLFARMTGHVNAEPIWMFPKGCLLFCGIDGQSYTEANSNGEKEVWYTINFDFEGMPNSKVSFPGMVGGPLEKDGYDYVWAYNEERASEDCTIFQPVYAYCEKVYPRADFSVFARMFTRTVEGN